MKGGIIKIQFILLLSLFFCVPVYGAGSQENEGVPVIVKWQNGHGFGEDGSMLRDGWAFDREDGCYVRFENGGVLVKADRILNTEGYGEFFTDTEQTSGTAAVRGEVIRHFSGNIRVVLENVETHAEKTCSLSDENEYRSNLPVSEGCYRIKEADAIWNKIHYKVSFSEESQEVETGGTGLFELLVLPESAGEDGGDAWRAVGEDKNKTDEAEEKAPSARAAGRKIGDEAEEQPIRWPEVYLILGIFIAAYGIYRYWAGDK